MLSRRCQSDEDWHQVSCHSFPCQRRFCRRRRRRRSGGGCCCGRLPQSACVLFQSPSQSIIHCDRARRREGEREAAGRREGGSREEGGREQRGTAGACREKLGKRRESAERSGARGGEAGRGGGEKRGAHPLPDPVGAQLRSRRLAPLRSALARGRARIVCGYEQPGGGLRVQWPASLERAGREPCARSFPGLEPRNERVRLSPGAGGSWLGARRG